MAVLNDLIFCDENLFLVSTPPLVLHSLLLFAPLDINIFDSHKVWSIYTCGYCVDIVQHYLSGCYYHRAFANIFTAIIIAQLWSASVPWPSALVSYCDHHHHTSLGSMTTAAIVIAQLWSASVPWPSALVSDCDRHGHTSMGSMTTAASFIVVLVNMSAAIIVTQLLSASLPQLSLCYHHSYCSLCYHIIYIVIFVINAHGERWLVS